jgi:CDP-diacylglycerol--serine O-phosphatidyltransferase
MIEANPQAARHKYIAVLPSLVTLMNSMCGFLSIIYASKGQEAEIVVFHRYGVSFFALSAYMIFFAMIADVLDGAVARMTKTSSPFGGQLDSLSDAVSFGVAPAFLMLKTVQTYIENKNLYFQPGFLEKLAGKSVVFIAILFVLCAITRLARFNVENTGTEPDHSHFTGLPTTPSAGIIISLVLFQKAFLPKIAAYSGDLSTALESVTTWALPIAALCCAFLMVSRIPYPNVSNYLFHGKKSFPEFLVIAFVVIFMIWNLQIALVLGLCGFAIYGVVRWGIKACASLIRRKPLR